ncbi:ATP-binding protein [Nocardia mexicana]|uniref:Putative ATPase n=1 Tax=Nocardia mexicana TaxID=279262 RepID=A0A370HC44_9NOCA|nr:NB-ARC domain-containing protein [Nocardia mexicana]RDI54516.1 putative ATPase [Nocardia mexicana]
MSEQPRHGNEIPAAASEFIGRHTELRHLGALLVGGDARLITLVGTGGIGKTALAAEGLRRYRDPELDAVHWIRLARLAPGTDSDTVAEEVVGTVLRSDIAGRSAWECLVETFTATDAYRTFLVLDNCEHVLDGVRPLITALLATVPGLVVVATSREPVGWVDEQVVAVPSLSAAHALELFRYRAELTGRPLPDDPDTHRLAARICQHTDHNPLFIRLAAARLLHRPLSAVLRELTGDTDDKRLEWSHGVRAGAEERHHSVHDVIAWSYGLCTGSEQLLLERMSIFAAGFDPVCDDNRACSGAETDAIVAVCGDDPLSPERVLQLLERVVERSLVSTHMTATSVYYYLPESVRVFAREQLRRRDPDAAARLLARHRRYYRDGVVAGHTAWYGPNEEQWLEWARSAWDNILLSIESSLTDPAEAVIGLTSASTLMALRVPFVAGANRAVTHLTEQALEVTRGADTAPAELRITAAARVGIAALWQGRSAYTAQLLDECVAAYMSDPQLRMTWRQDPGVDIGLPAVVEFTWGQELLLMDEDPRAIDVLARARTKFAAAGDHAGVRRAELSASLARAFLGGSDSGHRQQLDRSLDAVAGWAISEPDLRTLIDDATVDGRRDSVALARAILKRHVATGNTWTSGWIVHCCIGSLAHALAERIATGYADPAELTAAATEIAVLQGGVETLHRSIGVDPHRVPLVARGIQRAVEVATSVLGRPGYAAAARRGARLRPELEELQRYFLGTLTLDEEPDEHSTPPVAGSLHWDDLSVAEQDVAVLVAAGWPNSAIAGRRGTSVRTVDAQVVSIRRKLFARNRSVVIEHIPAELSERVRAESQQRPARSRQ